MQKRLTQFLLALKRKALPRAGAVAVESAEIFYIAIASGNGTARHMMVRAAGGGGREEDVFFALALTPRRTAWRPLARR